MPLIYRHGRPTIGVLAGWQFYRTATNLSYLLPVFRGIKQAAQDLGCNVLLGCGMGASASPNDPPRPAWPFPSPDVDFVPIGPHNTDGLIIFTPLHSPFRSANIQDLRAAGHPVLFIGSGESGPTLVADNQGGIFEAVRHLVAHGHRQIAFLAGSPDDLEGDTGERLTAYQAALASYGLEFDARRVVFGRHVYAGGYSGLQQIIRSGAGFSAVVASNDESALGVIQALKETGRSVPQDVAVIGFDNRLEGAAHKPSLSSIHLPLFNMGHQAVAYMFQHITEGVALPGIVRVATRLVARESCGCGGQKIVPARVETLAPAPAQWMDILAASVMNQAQNLEERECRWCCQRLVDSFALSAERDDGSLFLQTLAEVLQRTVRGDDDTRIWEDAVARIALEFERVHGAQLPSARWMGDMLEQTRRVMSDHMQQHHRQYVSAQRWISSRLSLLTTSLLTALDEAQIYAILAQHLPVMDLKIALIALFEAEGSDAFAWSTIRNLLTPDPATIRCRSILFPPPALLPADQPFHLVLIPVVDQTGQLGYMVFGIENLDLYGAIVQQLGGALNTARLYRQATEGRRLAEESNRMKSRFLSTISHELRTPLNLIVGLSGMVLRANDEGDTPLPDPALKDVERIHMYSQHLGGLIGDVLDLATSDAGQLRLNNNYIELGPVLRVVAESGRQLASDKGLTWQSTLPESGPWVWGDQTRLRQVALNLINNAIKFTQQGSVSLRLDVGADSATVMVSDTGLGIALDEQQVIFDEFRQSESSVARGYGGLGLGLAISKRLIEMHGGTIGVHSSGQEGGGSTFYFTLPTVKPLADQVLSATLQSRVKPGELVFSGLAVGCLTKPIEPAELTQALDQHWLMAEGDLPLHTILVVDDEPNTLEMNARIVQSHSSSNRVLKAHHGREALDILERETVDLVLLDLQMPEMDGFSVLEMMRASERLRNIPVIVVTGKVLTETDMARLNRGVAAVLGKGLFSLDETTAHIRMALERKRRLSGEAQRLVRKAMAYIHEHYADPISRRDIAQHVSIAEDHLTFCFRQELGTTPIEYLQRYRIHQAKRLLKDSQRAITEVALDVGFSDSGYFSRIFRRITGMSPEAYRRSGSSQ